MYLTTENILLVGSVLLFVSILAGKSSFKFGVPTLVLFLAIGMLAGTEGIGKIHFTDPKAAQFIGIVSLNFILFSGGLNTSWTAIRPVLKPGIVLSTLGVILTATTMGIFVWWVTDWTIYESLLLGSIVSSTDAAAVFSILRSKKLGLKNNLRPMLELESGSNDPMAYILMISFLGLTINQDKGLLSVFPSFFYQMIVGAIGGLFFGRLSKIAFNRINLEFEGLYPVMAIALMFITFTFTDAIKGNGFLAIYIAGVYLGNHDFIHKKSIEKAFDGFAWLMEIVLFLTLGLLVFPSQLWAVAGIGILISLFLIVVARPVSVFISMKLFKMRMKTKLFISWVGLRGAVPIVFATYPMLAGIDKADMIFNIVFFISLTSILIQGTTLSFVAQILGVALPEKIKPKVVSEAMLTDVPRKLSTEMIVHENDYAAGRKIVELSIPKNATIAIIKRGSTYLTPHGSSVLEPGDILTVLGDTPEVFKVTKERLETRFIATSSS